VRYSGKVTDVVYVERFVQNASPSIEISLMKTLQFLDASDERLKTARDHLNSAVQHGSVMARYLLWERKYEYSADWVCLPLYVIMTSFARLCL